MEQSPDQQAPPRVSAILVSLNNAAALRRSLAALEASADRQTLEISVVDSGSTDDCSRMDAEFPGIHMHRLPRNFGVVKALNIAMRTARGEFFLFLEPGAEVAPNTTTELAARLEAAADAVAVCPLVVNAAGETLTRAHPLPLPAELLKACRAGDFRDWSVPDAGEDPVEVDYVKPPVMLVRSYFLRGLRFLDERYGQHWWDLEICTHIRRSAKKILLFRNVRMVFEPELRPTQLSGSARGLLSADQALGAALWVGKHYGSLPGWKFRLTAILLALRGALVGVLSFRDVGYRIAFLSSLIGGQTLDGSQTSL